jgi:hypothetical protein
LLDWLESWAVRRQLRDAALAVFNETDAGSSGLTAAPALSRFAARNHLGFIDGNLARAGSELAARHPFEDPHQRATAQTAALHSVMSRPIERHSRHWGLNE